MWAWMGALGVSEFDGIVSSAYGVYRQKRKVFLNKYLDHLLRTKPYTAEYMRRSTGIRNSRLRLYTDDFFDIPIISPPLDEQAAILEYLDNENKRIDTTIQSIRREIELVQEYRTTLISDAVTGKIDVR